MIDAAGAFKDHTFGEFGRLLSHSLRVVGTPEQVADQLEGWAREASLDGFNLVFARTPGSFVDCIEQVAPVLKARGLMQSEYRPGTLREKLFCHARAHLPERHPARAMRRNFTAPR